MQDDAQTDHQVREALSIYRSIEPSELSVQQVLKGESQRRKRRRGAVATGVVLAAFGLAVPPVNAAIGNLADDFASYFEGDPKSVGGPAHDAPTWLTAGERERPVQLADGPGGSDLSMVTEPSGSIGFALGEGVAVSDTPESWMRQFEAHDVQLLGVGATTDDLKVHLYGVVSDSVTQVEVVYESGETARAILGNGGFVAVVDSRRQPVELVVRGGDGETLEATDLAGYYPWERRIEG